MCHISQQKNAWKNNTSISCYKFKGERKGPYYNKLDKNKDVSNFSTNKVNITGKG